jgi:hypothetical protein
MGGGLLRFGRHFGHGERSHAPMLTMARKRLEDGPKESQVLRRIPAEVVGVPPQVEDPAGPCCELEAQEEPSEAKLLQSASSC